MYAAYTYRLRAQELKLAKTTGIGWPAPTTKAEKENRRKGEEEKAAETPWEHPFDNDEPTPEPVTLDPDANPF